MTFRVSVCMLNSAQLAVDRSSLAPPSRACVQVCLAACVDFRLRIACGFAPLLWSFMVFDLMHALALLVLPPAICGGIVVIEITHSQHQLAVQFLELHFAV